MNGKGIDISAHNGSVDMKKIKAEGIDFVMIRASYGNGHEDTRFRENVKKCNAAGMPWGAYHYSYALSASEAKKEARKFLKIVRRVKGRSYPLVVDIEDADGYKRKRGMSVKDEIPVIKTFRKIIGEDLMLYCNLSYYKTLVKAAPALIVPMDLWLAHWKVSKPGAECQMWQYTSEGKVKGSSSRTDLNRCYKDYTGSDSTTRPEKEPLSKGQEVMLQTALKVRAGGGTNFRWKKRKELTADGRKNAMPGIHAVLKKGTSCTILSVVKKSGEVWIQIPSGFICASKGSSRYVK